MSSWITVARREMQGRLMGWAVALALGLVPLGLPRLLGYTHGGGTEVRMAAASVLALLFVALFAVLVGGNMVGGELANRRMAFYLARPLSTAAIFGGKAAALAALLVGAQLLVWLPSMLVDPMRSDLWPAVVILLASTPLFVGAGLAGGVTARCRSPWLLVDGVVALATLALFTLLARELMLLVWLHPAAVLRMFVTVGLSLGMLAAALLAGAGAALARGRTDARRAHRAMSIVLALTLLPAGGTALAVTASIDSVNVRRLVAVTAAVTAPAGDWIYVSGPVDDVEYRGYQPDFFLQLSTGRSRQLKYIVGGPFPSFSPDGTRVAWVEAGNLLDVLKDRAPAEDVLVVGAPGDARSERRVPVDNDTLAVGWSPDGRRVTLFGETRVELRDAATLRLIAATPALRAARFVHAQFTADGLRAFARDDRGVTVLALSEAGTRQVARLETPVSWLDAAPSGDRVLLGRRDGKVDLVSLAGDGRTRLEGVSVAPLADENVQYAYQNAGGFLPDGRIALLCGVNHTGPVCLYDAAGRLLHTVTLGTGAVRMGPMTARGLVVGVDPNPKPNAIHERLHLIDVDAGSERALDERWRLVWTAAPLVGTATVPRLLVRDMEDRLISWDLASDPARTLIPNH